jgi:DNA-binding HxlR family transcriptional regulator
MTRKSYRQHCGVARALDVVAERWTLLIVRNLLLGPRRYSDLLTELPGITTNLLAKRLRELEGSEIIEKEVLAPPLGVTVYRLTISGRALEPVIMELGRWGGRFMAAPNRGDTINLGWALLSLKRRYRGGLERVLEIRAGERRYCLEFSPDSLVVEERAAEHPDLVLTGAAAVIRALFFELQGFAELEAAGKLSLGGSRASFREVERAFDPPQFGRAPKDQALATTRRKLSSRNSSVSSKSEL